MDSTPTKPSGNPRSSNGRTPARTPSRRAISDPPSSARRSVHTPLDRSVTRDLLNSVRRGLSASGGPRRNNAPTPHAQAARRALNERRTAMFTPGRNRRRSARDQRETPMGILRDLGRALAPASQAIQSSSSPRSRPSNFAPIREEDDDEDELTIERPRLSLPIDEDDEDDDDLQPPRSSGLEEENYTVRSVELPRRATTEQPLSRLSRGSFGSVRESDVFNNHPTGELGRQSDFFPGLLEDLQARADAGADFAYQRVDDDDATRRTTLGRESDFGLQMPEGLGDQTTFVLSEPGGDAAPTSPLEERTVTGAVAGNEGDADEPPVLFGDNYDDDNDMPNEPLDPFDPVPDDVPEDNVHDEDLPEDEMLEDEEDVTGATAEVTTTTEVPRLRRDPKARLKRKRISRFGVEYPPLPPAFVKRVAQSALQSSGLSNPRISADTLTALTQASEWFFEQLGDDLAAYSDHARRKTIEEADVVTLMRRQRQIGSTATMFSLAQKHLPRELLQELRMPVPQTAKQRRSKKAG